MSQSKFKKASLLAGTALVAAGVMTAGTASADGHAKVVSSGTDKTAMKIAGHVSRQITYMDDGTKRVRHSDSNFSSTRLVITASGKINPDLKIGSKIETAFDDARNGAAGSKAEFDARSGNDVQTRKAEIYLTHSSLGKLEIGAGSMAADGITELGNTPFWMLPGQIALQNSGAFRAVSANGSDISEEVHDVFGQSDGLGRSTRIRYNTPNIGGFVASIAHQDDQSYDMGLRYSGKAMDTKIKLGVGYSVDNGVTKVADTIHGDGNEHFGAGIALQHSSGLGVSYGIEYINDTSRDDIRANDPLFQHMQVSFKSKMNEMGSTQFIYEYIQHENKQNNNDTAVAHTVGFAQNIDAAASEVGLRYSHMELDRDGSSFTNDDVDALSLHLRMKF